MIAMSPSVLQNPKKQSVSKNITLNIIEFALRTCARARAISYSCNMKSQVDPIESRWCMDMAIVSRPCCFLIQLVDKTD